MKINKLPDNRIYYAQNREDLILESFFPDIKNGFYVDVGACHPHIASVTKRFYLRGWRGINIEPQTVLYDLFDAERKRDINLNVGVSDKRKKVTLRTYIDNRGLSTTDPKMKEENAKNTENHTDRYEDVEVETLTLNDILRQNKVKSIQFLKVDVEGYEYEVLNGNDWSRYRPEVICIEANHVTKDWRPLLEKNRYKKVFFDGLNEYYVDLLANKTRQVDFVNHILLKLKGGVSADDYEKRFHSSTQKDELASSWFSTKLKNRKISSRRKKAILESP